MINFNQNGILHPGVLHPELLNVVLSKAAEPCHSSEFSIAIQVSFAEVSKNSLVCRQWQEMQTNDVVWGPIVDLFIKNCKYELNISSTMTCISKVKLFMESLCNLKSIFLKSKILFIPIKNIHYKKGQDCTPLYMMEHHNNKLASYNTFVAKSLLKQILNNNGLEHLAKFILFMPELESNEIAKYLFNMPMELNPTQEKNVSFVLNLMTKLNYDMSDTFNKISSVNPSDIVKFVSLGICNGVTYTNFISSGCIFNRTELSDSKFSFLHAFLPRLELYYQTGKFKISSNMYCDPFIDPKLKSQPNTFSETDLKNFILDLLTKAELDLDRVCPTQELWFFQGHYLYEGTALSQLRQLGEIIPKPNAISEALKEYDLG